MSFGKLLACSALVLACLGRRAVAQERDVDLAERQPLVVSGFGVGLATYDRNLAQNGAMASKIALSLFRPWSDQLYLFGQLTTHVSVHDSEPVHTHIEIDNLIFNWTPAGASALTLSFGRFDSPIGYERDDEPLNLIPTESFTAELARPVKFTGLLARYVVNPRLSLLALVANGWDREADNNSGKTAALKLQLFPGEHFAVGLSGLYGPESDATNGLQRALFSADATLQPLPSLILQAEAHRGTERAAGAAGTSLGWTAASATLFLRAARSFGLSVRADMVDDGDGATTGTPQTLRSVTLSPWYFYREAEEGVFSNVEFTSFRLPAFALRPALRFDHSDQPVFERKDGTLSRTNVTALAELVYVF
jgi:hypothetical protein